MSGSNSTVLGVVILARHGDRQGFYQDPDTYAAANTVITPLGVQEEFIQGQFLRSLYLNSTSPSFIPGVNSSLADPDQITVRADAGGEGGVIMNSATALLQGLFPADSNYTTTLANGTTVEGPLNGYQYIEIDSVEPDNDVSLEGWTSCAPFDTATSAFYNSTEFKQKANESASFLSQLPQYLDGRPVTLQNMWNIFDFMNVNYIHNAGFRASLPPSFLPQARTLAGFHEYGVFTDPELGGIGNIAFRTMIPGILDGLANINDASNPTKIVYNAIAYKAFLTLFNMTGAAVANPQLTNIVNYAAVVALEVRQASSGGEPVLRLNFKNGTEEPEFTTYDFMNSTGDVPLSTFVNYFAPVAINTTSDWCSVCSNTQDRGCDQLAAASSQARAAIHQPISPVGAGFLGAGLTLFVALCMLGMLFFLGFLSIGKGRHHRTRGVESEDSHSMEKKA